MIGRAQPTRVVTSRVLLGRTQVHKPAHKQVRTHGCGSSRPYKQPTQQQRKEPEPSL